MLRSCSLSVGLLANRIIEEQSRNFVAHALIGAQSRRSDSSLPEGIGDSSWSRTWQRDADFASEHANLARPCGSPCCFATSQVRISSRGKRRTTWKEKSVEQRLSSRRKNPHGFAPLIQLSTSRLLRNHISPEPSARADAVS